MKEPSQEQTEGGGLWAADGGAREAVEALPTPLDQIVADVFRCYEARSPEELARLMLRRYREDACYIEPTLMSCPRSDVALSFYSLQRLFSSVEVSDISQPAVALQERGKGPPLLQVLLSGHQRLAFARANHISRQILPEDTCRQTVSRLLIDTATGQVVLHEDSWTNKPTPLLPLAWRRLNAKCINGLYRLLGWGRTLEAAEAAVMSCWDD